MLDEIIDFFSESWDFIIEGLEYAFTFEWFGDLGEFFSAMFEGISDFSITGLILGIITVAFIYALRTWMLYPFLAYYSPTMKLIWGAITYLGCFAGGYFLGKAFENLG